MPVKTTDAPANAQEYIAQAAKTLGTSVARHKVFKAIYRGKRQAKTVAELMQATGLSQVRVLQEGAKLDANHVVDQEKIEGRTAYRKRAFIQHHKAQILRLAGSPTRLKTFPTKWSRGGPGSSKAVMIRLRPEGAKTRQISIDDIDSFRRVRIVKPQRNLPPRISERQFKEGVKRILGEHGRFQDWGGEVNDLYSTRLRIGGSRRAAAFGFKGPGTSGKLTPKKMGKNGDQVQRLFESAADVFIVQYRGEIDQSIIREMEAFAVNRSLQVSREILYAVIDGQDSHRIYRAYRTMFGSPSSDASSH